MLFKFDDYIKLISKNIKFVDTFIKFIIVIKFIDYNVVKLIFKNIKFIR